MHLDINGGRVVFDLVGPDDGLPLVLTPGGRFGMDFPGVRQLGEALAAGGMRVLLWDRPNCGHSDVQFFGRTESHMRAETLTRLLQELDFGPAVLAGGSGGARDSMVTALLFPDVATKLVLWSIVGGVFGITNLACVYNLPQIRAAYVGGMGAVASLPGWAETIALNPNNRQRLIDFDRAEFLDVQLRWLSAFVPKPGQIIPGVDDEDFQDLTLPTLIVRGGIDDLDHPRQTSFDAHALIRSSVLVDPPWPEDAWERGTAAAARGEGGIFDYWATGAPTMLNFIHGS